MVAARLTLLSLAALSSCMFGAFRGAPRVGRLARRLSPPDNGGPSNATMSSTSQPSSSSSSSSLSPSSSLPLPMSTSAAPVSSPPCLTCSASVASVSAGAPGAPVPVANTRKGPPPIPSRSSGVVLATTTTSVDFSRPQTTPPAGTSTKPSISAGPPTPVDVVWPPSGDDYKSSQVPSDILSGWSATRGRASWDWGDATTQIQEINTWTSVTWTGGWVTVTSEPEPTPTGSVSVCQQSDFLKPSTVYSITHTTTITWTGNPKDYTPPYPPISTPTPCVRPGEGKQRAGPQRLTLSRCTSTGTDAKYRTCEVTTVYEVSEKPKITWTSAMPIDTMPVVTFITTDKNPAVVFPPISTPDYGTPGTTRINVKDPPGGVAANPTPPAVNNNGDPTGKDDRPFVGAPVTVSVRPGVVVINDQVFTDSPLMSTQVVRVNGELFTIEPTRVVGAGATVIRPGSGSGGGSGSGSGAVTGGSFAPQSTTVGGVPVFVSGREAVIDGTTFSLDASPGPTTKVVGDRTVSIGPAGIAVATGGSDPAPARLTPGPAAGSPQQTEVVVAGGELITAVGQSVLVVRSTTITYGPGLAATTVDVNGEPVVAGPGGITMHGTVLGGPSARAGETQFEIVGGATITQLAPSLVVIRGSTFTVGPGATSTTVVVGRETVTIGPTGVVVSSMSFYYPLGPTAATTITPGATAAAATSSPTGRGNGGDGSGTNGDGGGGGGGGGDSKKDVAAGLRPASLLFNIAVSCIVVVFSLSWL